LQVTRIRAIDLWIDVTAFEAQIAAGARHNRVHAALWLDCVETLKQAEAVYTDSLGNRLPIRVTYARYCSTDSSINTCFAAGTRMRITIMIVMPRVRMNQFDGSRRHDQDKTKRQRVGVARVAAEIHGCCATLCTSLYSPPINH
jgi:hypothetical protein